MKTHILILGLLCGLAGAAQAQVASIGINTENPQGVLHIDGASSAATTNPQAGSVSAAQASDDVVIDSKGRIGAGLVSPEAKVDLSSDTPGGALRIQDGTEGAGKYLFSDETGLAFWAPLAVGSWYAALYEGPLLDYNTGMTVRSFDNYNSSLISPSGTGAVDAAAGSVELPVTGKYRVSISIYWESNRVTGAYLTKGILRVNGSDHKTFTYWGGGGGTAYGVLPSFVYVLDFNAGDLLTLATDETGANHANKAQAVLFMVELLL